MLTRLFALTCVVLAFGCGSTDSTPAASPAGTSDTSVTATAQADAAPAATAKTPDAKPAPKSKAASANDVIPKTLSQEPGDLVVVFTNNVDGEIEPCG